MDDRVLAIFARYPRLGAVKTRLAPALGPCGCLRLHVALLRHALTRTRKLGLPRVLYLADCPPERLRRLRQGAPEWLEAARVMPQRSGSLGQRLEHASEQLLRRHRRVAFIGIDSPTLPLAWIAQAFELLRTRPVAIGPAIDGGYCLIATGAVHRELFRGIEWGSDQVLGQTLKRIPDENPAMLPSWYDVDRPEDLARLAGDPECPVSVGRLLSRYGIQPARGGVQP